jgi:hypothetical protein
VGPPASGKTHVLLSLAVSVATGSPFLGHAVQQGPVVYIAAEGVGSVSARVAAWSTLTGGLQDLKFIADAVQFMSSPDVDELLSAIAGLRPALIVVDTLARCFVGGDENTSRDVGRFVQGLDAVRLATGATVAVAHHSPKGGSGPRGSSALEAACDTLVLVEKREQQITLTSAKQRDGKPFEKQHLRLFDVAGSVVATASEGGPSQSAGERAISKPKAKLLLAALGSAGDGGLRTGEWLAASGLAESTFHRYRKMLVDCGLVCTYPTDIGRWRCSQAPTALSLTPI